MNLQVFAMVADPELYFCHGPGSDPGQAELLIQIRGFILASDLTSDITRFRGSGPLRIGSGCVLTTGFGSPIPKSKPQKLPFFFTMFMKKD